MNRFKTQAVLITSAIFFANPYESLAQECDQTQELCNPLQSTSILELLERLFRFLTQLLVPLLVLAVIFAGFKFVKAQGNSREIEEAKNVLKSVLIGAAIILSARLIIALLQTTIGSI